MKDVSKMEVEVEMERTQMEIVQRAMFFLYLSVSPVEWTRERNQMFWRISNAVQNTEMMPPNTAFVLPMTLSDSKFIRHALETYSTHLQSIADKMQ